MWPNASDDIVHHDVRIPSVSREDEALAVVVAGMISAEELLQEDAIGTTEA